jgi:dienelactone hydrolase
LVVSAEVIMSFKRLAIFGVLALGVAAAIVAVAVVHLQHGGLSGIHHHAAHASSVGSGAAAHSVRAGVAALGKQWNESVAEATTELYAGLPMQDTSGIRHISDLEYGPHEQQRLDLFVPEGGFSELTTVLVYLGDEMSHAGPNIGNSAANVGAIGVVARYREAPSSEWSTRAEDVRGLLTWLRDNIEPYGGNPHNILLIGHSMGAAHVATYLFDEASQLPGGPGITAAILSSGAFGEGDDLAHTPLALVDSYSGPTVPILLWSAEYDVPAIETSVAELYAKLCSKYAGCPMFVQLQGHNHDSPVLSIGTEDTTAAEVIMRFYHRVIDTR